MDSKPVAEQVHDYYSARAPEYDRIYRKPERQTDLRQLECWLPQRLAGRRILEIACGTGYWTHFLAPVAHEIVAIDAAEETLRIARERVADTRVRFRQGDAYALPEGDAPFSGAFAGFWLSHVPISRLNEFLGALSAQVEPGARVVFIDNRYVAGSSTPLTDRDAEGNTYQIRTLTDGSTYRVLKNFPDANALRTLGERHGEAVQVTEWEYFWALEYRKPLSP